MATTQQVADFYGVDYTVITTIVNRKNQEFEQDGCTVFKVAEIKNLLSSQLTTLEKSRGKVIAKLKDGSEVQIATRGLRLFPKRAILRVGMLLRDSEVAQEVRTQLLNIEEKVEEPVKVADIDEQDMLMLAVMKAPKDSTEQLVALSEYNSFMNRYKIENNQLKLENKVEEPAEKEYFANTIKPIIESKLGVTGLDSRFITSDNLDATNYSTGFKQELTALGTWTQK